ncbi:MAG: hypothetical protein HFI66_08115 [Lachnospiraceae bacterium]|nr:hypothetical protein [Lachnospiraceae bacterium]
MNFRLYSAEETIQRALSRPGEQKYSLLFSNCEHFSVWCKTGVSRSYQVNQASRLPEMTMTSEPTPCISILLCTEISCPIPGVTFFQASAACPDRFGWWRRRSWSAYCR